MADKDKGIDFNNIKTLSNLDEKLVQYAASKIFTDEEKKTYNKLNKKLVDDVNKIPISSKSTKKTTNGPSKQVCVINSCNSLFYSCILPIVNYQSNYVCRNSSKKVFYKRSKKAWRNMNVRFCYLSNLVYQ